LFSRGVVAPIDLGALEMQEAASVVSHLTEQEFTARILEVIGGYEALTQSMKREGSASVPYQQECEETLLLCQLIKDLGEKQRLAEGIPAAPKAAASPVVLSLSRTVAGSKPRGSGMRPALPNTPPPDKHPSPLLHSRQAVQTSVRK